MKNFLLTTENNNNQFPSFDHALKDPIENDIQVLQGTKIVFVEGNYLLLPEHDWKEVRAVLDFVYFIEIDLSIAKERLARRHMQAWDWSYEKAMERVNENDYLNMVLIQRTSEFADKIIIGRG